MLMSSPTRPYPRRGDSCISQMALRRQPFPSIPKVNRKSSTYCEYGELLYFLVSKFENSPFSEQTKFPKCTFRMQWSQKRSYCTQIAFRSKSSWGQSTIKAEMAKTLYTFIAFVSFLLLRIQNQIFVLGQVAIFIAHLILTQGQILAKYWQCNKIDLVKEGSFTTMDWLRVKLRIGNRTLFPAAQNNTPAFSWPDYIIFSFVVDSLAGGEEVNEGVEEGDEAEGVLVVCQPELVKGNCQGYEWGT